MVTREKIVAEIRNVPDNKLDDELHLREIDDSIEVVAPDASGEPPDEYAANLTFLGFDFRNFPVLADRNWDEIIIGRDIINR